MIRRQLACEMIDPKRATKKFPLACARRWCHSAPMPYRPKRSKKPEARPEEPGFNQVAADQFADRRRRDMATRSTLSRLRNRKSDLK
jgi:hypothetical protein